MDYRLKNEKKQKIDAPTRTIADSYVVFYIDEVQKFEHNSIKLKIRLDAHGIKPPQVIYLMRDIILARRDNVLSQEWGWHTFLLEENDWTLLNIGDNYQFWRYGPYTFELSLHPIRDYTYFPFDSYDCILYIATNASAVWASPEKPHTVYIPEIGYQGNVITKSNLLPTEVEIIYIKEKILRLNQKLTIKLLISHTFSYSLFFYLFVLPVSLLPGLLLIIILIALKRNLSIETSIRTCVMILLFIPSFWLGLRRLLPIKPQPMVIDFLLLGEILLHGILLSYLMLSIHTHSSARETRERL